MAAHLGVGVVKGLLLTLKPLALCKGEFLQRAEVWEYKTESKIALPGGREESVALPSFPPKSFTSVATSALAGWASSSPREDPRKSSNTLLPKGQGPPTPMANSAQPH